MFQFEHTKLLWALLALLPLATLFIYVLKWKQKIKKQLGDERLINTLTNNHSSKNYNIKIVLILAAIALSILGLAGLRKPLPNKDIVANGLDVMIALDISKSMLSADIKPTRLDKAKQFIYQLADNLQNNQVGLVVFAGEAFLQLPLTADVNASKFFISNANTDLVNLQGTNIADALNLCSTALDTKHKTAKVIILITDGETHDDKTTNAVDSLKERGIIVYTIGIGSVEGSPIIEAGTNDYKRDNNGETVITKLNEKLLQKIATETNGSYFHLSDNNSTATDLNTKLSKLDKQPIQSAGIGVLYQTYYLFFVAVAIIILVVEVFISERKKVKN